MSQHIFITRHGHELQTQRRLKVRFMYTMEYHSVIREYENSLFATPQKSSAIMFCEILQNKEDKYLFLFI